MLDAALFALLAVAFSAVLLLAVFSGAGVWAAVLLAEAASAGAVAPCAGVIAPGFWAEAMPDAGEMPVVFLSVAAVSDAAGE